MDEASAISALRYGSAILLAASGAGKSDLCRNGDDLGYTVVDCAIFSYMREGKWHTPPSHVERLSRSGVSCAVNADNAADLLGWHYCAILIEPEYTDDFKNDASAFAASQRQHNVLLSAVENHTRSDYSVLSRSTAPRLFQRRE